MKLIVRKSTLPQVKVKHPAPAIKVKPAVPAVINRGTTALMVI